MAGLGALCFAYILSQFYRSFLAVLTPVLTAELGATNSDLALASGAWFSAFAMMQFAVGIGLDRYGPRITAALLLGVAASSGVFLFSFAQAPSMIVAAMALIGIGCSPVLMASFFIFAQSFSPARFAFLASVFIGFGNLGNIFGASPLAAAVEFFGWRMVLFGFGIFTIVIALTIFLVVRDPAKPDGNAAGKTDSGFAGYFELIKIKQLWFIIPIMLVMYASAAGIRGLWVGPFLAEVYSADALQIGNVTLYMAIAMAVGSFIYGPLDTVFNSRKWVVFGGGVLGVSALYYLSAFALDGLLGITIALIVLSLAGLSFGVIMAHGKAFFPSNLVGRGVTLLNFFSIGGVGLLQITSGYVLQANTLPSKPEAGFSVLFLFYASVVGMALLIYLFSDDAKPKHKIKTV